VECLVFVSVTVKYMTQLECHLHAVRYVTMPEVHLNGMAIGHAWMSTTANDKFWSVIYSKLLECELHSILTNYRIWQHLSALYRTVHGNVMECHLKYLHGNAAVHTALHIYIPNARALFLYMWRSKPHVWTYTRTYCICKLNWRRQGIIVSVIVILTMNVV